MISRPQHILQTIFGFQDFRPPQNKIIKAILQNQPTLALLPTGQGKSLCFQIPGLIFSGYTLVISPLISLMKDQVDALEKRNITATYINSSLSKKTIDERLQNIAQNKYKFIYVAPERLLQTRFNKLMKQNPPRFVALDEAHCFSMWGHDFRPSYRSIPDFLNQLPTETAFAAFTATASPKVVIDLQRTFKINKTHTFYGKFFRQNLFLDIRTFTNRTQKYFWLCWFLKNHSHQAGIIYATTRAKTEQIVQALKKAPFENELKIAAYHAGLSTEDRTKIQTSFIKNELKIIVATNAFGMGIDKTNVRFVIHFQLPGNIENYVQEIGRAGRDQQPAHCILLFHPNDIEIQKRLISNGETDSIKRKIGKLKKIISFLKKNQCHHQKILNFFHSSEIFSLPCNNCSICQTPDYENDLLNIATLVSKLEKVGQRLALKHRLPAQQILPIIIAQQLIIFENHSPKALANFIGVGDNWRKQWYSSIVLR